MKQQILSEIQKCREIAAMRGYHLPEIPIDFSLSGCTAGKCIYKKYSGKIIKLNFNLALAERYPDEFLKRTVYHEMAHALQFMHHPNSKPHGPEWDFFCRILTGSNMSRCHSYNTTGIKRKRKTFKYCCDCNTQHVLSSVIHNRIQSGWKYSCKKCKSEIRLLVATY